jgi:hypothetical protein
MLAFWLTWTKRCHSSRLAPCKPSPCLVSEKSYPLPFSLLPCCVSFALGLNTS